MSDAIEFHVIKYAEGVFRVSIESIPTPIKLKETDNYIEFNPKLEFAGISKYGEPLSIRRTKGPAQFGGHPLIIPSKTKKYSLIENLGFLFKTPTPAVVVIYENNRFNVYLEDNSQLLDRYEEILAEEFSSYSHRHFNIITTSMEFGIKFHSKFKDCRLFGSVNHQDVNIGIPINKTLSKNQWQELGKHAVQNLPDLIAAQTVSVLPKPSTDYKWLPGETIQDIKNTHGIEIKPLKYCNGSLGFNEFKITDPKKAAVLNHHFIHCKGKTITCQSEKDNNSREYVFLIEDVMKIPLLFSKLKNLALANHNYIYIDFIHTFNMWIKEPIRASRAKFKDCVSNIYYLPFEKVHEHFVTAAYAAENYSITNANIVTLTYRGGPYIFKKDLATLEKKDTTAKPVEIVSRLQYFTDKYGELPKHILRLTDKQIDDHFELKTKVAAGELFHVDSIKGIINGTLSFSGTVELLDDNHRIIVCPYTREKYIERIDSLEGIAALPGFWNLLMRSTQKDSKCLAKIITSRTIQALATAELI